MIIKASFNTFLSEVITRVIVDTDDTSFILTCRLLFWNRLLLAGTFHTSHSERNQTPTSMFVCKQRLPVGDGIGVPRLQCVGRSLQSVQLIEQQHVERHQHHQADGRTKTVFKYTDSQSGGKKKKTTNNHHYKEIIGNSKDKREVSPHSRLIAGKIHPDTKQCCKQLYTSPGRKHCFRFYMAALRQNISIQHQSYQNRTNNTQRDDHLSHVPTAIRTGINRAWLKTWNCVLYVCYKQIQWDYSPNY